MPKARPRSTDALDQEPCEETLRELDRRGWTQRDIAEFCGVDLETIRDELHALGIENRRSTGGAGSPLARKLWRMDPDDLGGETA